MRGWKLEAKGRAFWTLACLGGLLASAPAPWAQSSLTLVATNLLGGAGDQRSTAVCIAGGADAVVVEVDPGTGSLISTALYGGAMDDIANGIATDGRSLYVVGESRSYLAAGNGAGQNDAFVLRYALNFSINRYAGLTIRGYPGEKYRIEYVNNLGSSNWATLTTMVLPGPSHLFIDTDSPNVPTRFYRAVLVP